MAELDTSGQVQEFLTVLKRRKWGIILPMLYMLTIGLLIAVIVPKKVEVVTRVELKETRVESDSTLKSPQNNAATKEIQSAAHHIKHHARIRGIMETELPHLWELDYMGLDAGEKYRYINDVVKKNLSVHVEEKAFARGAAGSWFINIGYKDVNGARAEEFLGKLVERWVEDVIERDAVQLEEEQELLQRSLKDAETLFASASEKYTQICKTLGVDPSMMLDARSELVDSRDAVLSDQQLRQQTLATSLVRLENQILQTAEEMRDLPTTIETEEVIEAVVFTEAIQALEGQLLLLTEEQRRFVGGTPKWKKVQTHVELLERQILDFESREQVEIVEPIIALNPELGEMEDALRGLENEQDTTQKELDLVNRQVAGLVEDQRRRTQERDHLFSLYHKRRSALEDRDRKAEMLSNKERAVATVKSNYNKPYEVVQPPNADGAPVTPNTSILVIFFAIAGLGLGLAFSLLAEYGKNAYRSPHELAQVLPIPVLGAINSIVTSAQSRRKHARRTIVAVSSLLILGGLGWFTYMVWRRAEDLPVRVQQGIEDIRMKLL